MGKQLILKTIILDYIYFIQKHILNLNKTSNTESLYFDYKTKYFYNTLNFHRK